MKFYIDDYEENDYENEDIDSYLKWNYLLRNTFIVFSEPRILKKIAPISKRWLANYERTNNCRLPDDYKNFLSTYGAGTFGNNLINIGTPGKEIEEDRTLVVQTLEDYSDIVSSDPKFKAIENGYFFCSGSNGTFFLFDLNSFSSEDVCCDIYVLRIFEPRTISCLGRDFYFFVRELCLNNKIDEWLPNNFSLSSIKEDSEGESLYISECSGVFIPYWVLPESWE